MQETQCKTLNARVVLCMQQDRFPSPYTSLCLDLARRFAVVQPFRLDLLAFAPGVRAAAVSALVKAGSTSQWSLSWHWDY